MFQVSMHDGSEMVRFIFYLYITKRKLILNVGPFPTAPHEITGV